MPITRSFVNYIQALSLLILAAGAQASMHLLPPPTSGEFCQAVQKILANTDMTANITVFDSMPDYRASKPDPDPLQIYQVITYDDKRPLAVSCKVKAADHIRDVHGENAAGEQLTCPVITQMVKDQAIAELEMENPPEVAARARTFIIEENEPYYTGQSYLQDFELSYRDPEGKVHFNTPGLQTDWENLLFWILPDQLRGQTYCHIPTVPYLKAIATGAAEAGTIMTTADDAQTKPPG